MLAVCAAVKSSSESFRRGHRLWNSSAMIKVQGQSVQFVCHASRCVAQFEVFVVYATQCQGPNAIMISWLWQHSAKVPK